MGLTWWRGRRSTNVRWLSTEVTAWLRVDSLVYEWLTVAILLVDPSLFLVHPLCLAILLHASLSECHHQDAERKAKEERKPKHEIPEHRESVVTARVVVVVVTL